MTTENKNTKILRCAMIISIALLVIIPVLCMNHQQGVISDIDNRKLQDFPSVEAEAPLSKQIESYYSDRIGFRKEMIGSYSVLNDKAFHLMTHPTYEYGTDGYVFFRYTDEPYDYDLIVAFADYIKQVQDYCTSRDIPFLYVISPEKARIYPEYIPDYVGEIPFSTDILKPLLDERAINYIDQADALLSAKNEGKQVFNVAFDAGHWNSEGMYAGSQMIVDTLQNMGVNVRDIDINDYTKEYTEQTTLPASFYPIHETTFMYQINPNVSYASTEHPEYVENLELDKNYHTCYSYTTNLPQDVDVLMFQGSYYNTQGTMLQNEFSSLTTIHDYQNIFSAPYFIDIYQPDVVIFENADYTVANAYYAYDSLISTTLPGPYDTYKDYKRTLLSSTIELTVDPSSTVSTFHTIWPTSNEISSLYVDIDNVIYDCIAEGSGTFKWGALTDTILNAQSISFIGIDNQSKTQFVIEYK